MGFDSLGLFRHSGQTIALLRAAIGTELKAHIWPELPGSRLIAAHFMAYCDSASLCHRDDEIQMNFVPVFLQATAWWSESICRFFIGGQHVKMSLKEAYAKSLETLKEALAAAGFKGTAVMMGVSPTHYDVPGYPHLRCRGIHSPLNASEVNDPYQCSIRLLASSRNKRGLFYLYLQHHPLVMFRG